MRIRKLRCSFCRKTEDQIPMLVAGPRLIVGLKLYICTECVAVANSIMQRNPSLTRTASGSLLQKAMECWRHLLQRCMARESSVA